MNTLRRLNKDPLARSILQRPSSALEFTENDALLKQTVMNSILNSSNKSLNRLSLNKSLNHLSPYSSLSDIANLINQSSAVTLGRLSPAILASTHGSKLGKCYKRRFVCSFRNVSSSLLAASNKPLSNAKGALDTLKQHNPLVKTVKQQLKEELRTAISERKRLLELRNRSDLSKTDKLALAFATTQPSLASTLMKGRSETDLKALTSGYLDPNTATNVSNLLNAQSNCYPFLNGRSSFLVDDVALKTNANSANQGGLVDGSASGRYPTAAGLETSNRDVSGKCCRFAETDYKMRGQNDSCLNDSPYLEILRSSLSGVNYEQPIGQTMTTTTFINSPINLSNYNSTFSNQYLKGRLETSLSNRLENALKETTIQDAANDRRSRLCQSSMSRSFDAPLRSNFKHSRMKPSLSTEYRIQDGLLDRELLGLDFKTTKLGELDAKSRPTSFYENYHQLAGGSSASIEPQDGKTYLFEQFFSKFNYDLVLSFTHRLSLLFRLTSRTRFELFFR